MENKINIAATENQFRTTWRQQPSAWQPGQKSVCKPAGEIRQADRKYTRPQPENGLIKERDKMFLPAGEWVKWGENDGLDFFLYG